MWLKEALLNSHNLQTASGPCEYVLLPLCRVCRVIEQQLCVQCTCLRYLPPMGTRTRVPFIL